MTTNETVSAERRGDVLIVTLNRPERLNAAPPAMFDALAETLSARGDARAVLITGTGRAFCSGADISGDAPHADGQGSPLLDSYNPAMEAVADLDVPVVSAVRGAAAGIGCSLALAADFCIASETAFFLQAFVNIGLVPDGGASWMLPRLIGRTRALEMMMLGERIPAATALGWGMIHKVVPDEALEAESLAVAERLAAGPTVALGLMRRQVQRSLESDYRTTLRLEAENQAVASKSADSREAAVAFLEKRKPRFRGT